MKRIHFLSRACVAVSMVLLLVCGRAFSEEPPVALPPTSVDASPYAACPPGSTACQAAASGESDAAQSKHEHLMAAARHLEAAGLKGEAAKLRQRAARAQRDALLAEKTAQIKALQIQIDRLRREAEMPGSSSQVLAHFKAIEIDRSKLRDLGFSVSDIGEVLNVKSAHEDSATKNKGGARATDAMPGGLKFDIVDRDSGIMAVLGALQKNQISKVLAEPTIAAVDMRPAYFHCGGKISVPVKKADGTFAEESNDYGTTIEFVTRQKSNDRLIAEFRLSLVELDMNHLIKWEGRDVPNLRERTIDTGVELKFGQTLVVTGMRWKSSHGARQCNCQEVIGPDKTQTARCDGDACPDSKNAAAPPTTEKELIVLVRFERVEAMDQEDSRPSPASARPPLEIYDSPLPKPRRQ